jgi:hypothetical protein
MAKTSMDLAAFVGKLLEEQDGDVLREGIRVLSQALMETEVAGLIGAERHERSGDRSAYRNGSRTRTWDTRAYCLDIHLIACYERPSASPVPADPAPTTVTRFLRRTARRYLGVMMAAPRPRADFGATVELTAAPSSWKGYAVNPGLPGPCQRRKRKTSPTSGEVPWFVT